MSLSNFNEVAAELLKLSKEIEQLQKQLNEEQQQRLQMEQTIKQLLDKARAEKGLISKDLQNHSSMCQHCWPHQGIYYALLFRQLKDHTAIEDVKCPLLDSTS